MDQKENQHRVIEETRERIGQIAGELAERANPPYVKAKIREAAERQADIAKEAVVRKAVIVEGRVLGSSTTYSFLGALGGWLVGAWIGKRFASSLAANAITDDRRAALRSSVGIGDQTAEALAAAKERASEAVSTAKERATEAVSTVKERAADAVTTAKERANDAMIAAREKIGGSFSHARERIPSPHDVSQRVDSFIHSTASDRPLLFALVPLCFGALFALLIPVSAQERKAFSAAKQKVNEQLSAIGEKVEDRIAQQGSQGEQGSMDEGARPTTTEVHIH